MAFDIDNFIKELKEMKVQELNEVVKAIEEEFGVSAAAPVAAAAAGGGEEGPSASTLVLSDVGGNKIAVIKLVKDMLGLGLMDAKKFVETPGQTIKENVSPEEQEEIIAKFKEAGATVEAK